MPEFCEGFYGTPAEHRRLGQMRRSVEAEMVAAGWSRHARKFEMVRDRKVRKLRQR